MSDRVNLEQSGKGLLREFDAIIEYQNGGTSETTESTHLFILSWKTTIYTFPLEVLGRGNISFQQTVSHGLAMRDGPMLSAPGCCDDLSFWQLVPLRK